MNYHDTERLTIQAVTDYYNNSMKNTLLIMRF